MLAHLATDFVGRAALRRCAVTAGGGADLAEGAAGGATFRAGAGAGTGGEIEHLVWSTGEDAGAPTRNLATGTALGGGGLDAARSLAGSAGVDTLVGFAGLAFGAAGPGAGILPGRAPADAPLISDLARLTGMRALQLTAGVNEKFLTVSRFRSLQAAFAVFLRSAKPIWLCAAVQAAALIPGAVTAKLTAAIRAAAIRTRLVAGWARRGAGPGQERDGPGQQPAPLHGAPPLAGEVVEACGVHRSRPVTAREKRQTPNPAVWRLASASAWVR